MKKLRWAMDSGFWQLDMATPATIDGAARAVPGESLPLGLSRGLKLSRPKQLHFMHKFMAMPLVPSFSPLHGFSLQRALPLAFTEHWFATLLGQFNLQRLISSIKSSESKHSTESSLAKNIVSHLLNKSLYVVGFCSEFMIGPDYSVLFSSEADGSEKGSRKKVVISQKLPKHNLTFEATWPGLFVDHNEIYWDVPLSMLVDLSSVASNSSYHLCIHHNSGHPGQLSDDDTASVPQNLLPGSCVKAAFSIRKDEDIWRSKGNKLRMVQPFDVFLSDPHVSLSGIIGTVVSACFEDKSMRLQSEDDSQRPIANWFTQGNGFTLSADLFSSVSCSAQYGNFQRLLFDLTRLNTRLDFPSGSKFISGATSLAKSLYNSEQPTLEAVYAMCPNMTLSFQQQIVGPASFRVDSRFSIGSKGCDRFVQVDETIFALEYALKVLGSAKAVAWYSPKHQEAMVELRFFES